MRMLLFFGSARKRGHTKDLVDLFIEELTNSLSSSLMVETVDAYRTSISPCIDCRYCWKKPGCAIDDIGQEIYRKIDQSDLIVIASPVYFHTVTGPLKIIIDRLQTYWAQHVRKDKPEVYQKKGVALLTGGAPSFQNQFLAAEIVCKGVFDDLNAHTIGIATAHSTDTLRIADNQEVKLQVKHIVQQIMTSL